MSTPPFSAGGWAKFAATAGAVATAYLAMRQIGSREAVEMDAPGSTSGSDSESRRWWRSTSIEHALRAVEFPHQVPWPFTSRQDPTAPTGTRPSARGDARPTPKTAAARPAARVRGKAARREARAERRLAQRIAPSPAPTPPPAPSRPARPPKPAPQSLVAILALHNHLAKALAQIEGASLGVEPEYIHRLRTSSRRARVAAKVWARPLGAALGSGDVKRASIALRTIGRAAGPVRDLDVWIGSLPGIAKREAPDVDVTPLITLAEDDRQAALVQFRALMSDPDVVWVRHTFLPRIAAKCAHLQETDEAVRMTVRGFWLAPTEAAINEIEMLGQDLSGWTVRRAEAIRNGASTIAAAQPFVEEERAHDVRLVAKRVRYTAELFQTCWDVPGANEALTAAVTSYTAIQEALGDWHDHIVWHDRIVEGAEILAMRDAEARASNPDAATRAPIDTSPFLRLSAHIRLSKAKTFDAIAATWEARMTMRDLARAVRDATRTKS